MINPDMRYPPLFETIGLGIICAFASFGAIAFGFLLWVLWRLAS